MSLKTFKGVGRKRVSIHYELSDEIGGWIFGKGDTECEARFCAEEALELDSGY